MVLGKTTKQNAEKMFNPTKLHKINENRRLTEKRAVGMWRGAVWLSPVIIKLPIISK